MLLPMGDTFINFPDNDDDSDPADWKDVLIILAVCAAGVGIGLLVASC